MGLPCPYNIVISTVLLHHKPHAFHVFRSESPVPLRVKVPKVQVLVLFRQESCNAPGDLTGHECFTPAWGFMVEQDPVAGKHLVAIAVIFRHPVGIQLGAGVRTPWLEMCLFVLRWRCRTVQFTARRLVKFYFVVATSCGFEDPGGTKACNITRIFRSVETDPDMALGTQVIDLNGPDIVHDRRKLFRIRQITIVKEDLCFRVMRVE